MNYYGEKSLSGVLKNTLNFLIVSGALVFLYVLIRAFMESSSSTFSFRIIFTTFLYLLGGISLLTILYFLRNIIDSLVKVTPFIEENVRSLRNISISCFIISLCYIVNFFVNQQYKNFKLIYIDSSGVHTDIEFIIFFFAGCFILILSYVFKQAVEVKEENDYTV